MLSIYDTYDMFLAQWYQYPHSYLRVRHGIRDKVCIYIRDSQWQDYIYQSITLHVSGCYFVFLLLAFLALPVGSLLAMIARHSSSVMVSTFT